MNSRALGDRRGPGVHFDLNVEAIQTVAFNLSRLDNLLVNGEEGITAELCAAG